MEPSPISASLGAMGSLTRKLDELLATRHWALRGSVTDEIEQLAADLHALHDLLAKLSNAQDPPVAARYWMKDVRELSYDMADCADQFVRADDRAKIHRAARRKIITRLKINRLPERWKWRSWITDKVSEFRSRVQEATQRYWRYKFDDCASNPGYPGVGRELPAVSPDPGDLVGIEGPMDELHRRLTSGGEQLKVVSIVGVGGIGKTTLAQKLWGKLRGQFECRAFVRTAQKPDMRGIIRSILSQVRRHQPPDPGEMHHLIHDLREFLRDKRYFIIIDDLWATSVWDVLSRAFPEGNCCSRIITTTEIMEVALASCDFCPEHIYKMESLSDDDSQKLLLQRILVSGNQQFDNVLPQIKRNCGGLPLAIIIAASLLASQPEKLEQLGCMQNSFGANHTMEGFMGQILNISFNSLPHYLKTCLLYLSTYSEGFLFLKGDLVKQWVAESFICAKEGEDMEEVAGSYFDELVSTGLIQAMDINYNYGVLSYSMHHMVLDLIAHKSIEENFITVVDYSQTAIQVTDKVRRLSLHFGSATYATTTSSIRLSQVRSLFFSGLFNCVPSFMVFKLLRVLVLHFWGDIGNTSFNLEGICELFWLRYLQVTCNVTIKLPDQIEPMKHLETLEINAGVCSVPPDIVRLSNLLHLRLRSGTNLPDGVWCMRSLRTLMYFDLGSSSEDNLWGLGELTNLRDLHLTYSSSLSSEHLKKKLIALATSLGKLGNLKSFTLASGAASMAVLFDGLSSLYSTPVFLERLELLPPICVFSRFPKWIGQLHKLCILKIAVRELLMNDIDSLTRLHSLTVLSLCVQTAPEQRIIFNDGAFPVLKYFKFRCGVLYMSFMSGAMQNLRRLKLHFDTHIGEKYDSMLAGVEHLLNLQDIAAQIGAATESDRRASESAFKDAISKHPRCLNFNVKWVDPAEEKYRPSEKQHQRQERGLSGEKHGVLEKAESTNKCADDWLSQNSDLPSSVASCHLKSESKVSQAIEVVESKASQAIEVVESEASQVTEVAESKASQAIEVAESEASQATEVEESKASPSTEVAESKLSPTYPHMSSTGGFSDKQMYIPFHVLEQTTSGFSDRQMIGNGGYGKVYKGVYNGEEIAVKLFYDVPALDNKQFENEFFNLVRIKHPNVVRLVGYCFETQHEFVEYNSEVRFSQHIYRILCFEYLQEGSLDKYLNESRDDDWRTRYNIIKGTCEGLNYLHEGCGSQLLHLDLKPANILLDKNMKAKIADFGLSRFFSTPHTHITNTTIGTKDYMPPEFISKQQVSAKNDVYSLGVIIIQIMAGRAGYSEFREMDDVTQFIELVNTNWRKRISATSSPCPSVESDQVETCIKIAVTCVDHERKNRPTVAEILYTLKETEKGFLKKCRNLMGQGLRTPTKSGPWGGSAGTARDIKEKPWRLESLTIGYLGLVDAFSFSYIDQAGKKQRVGPWGEGYIHDKIETICFGPSEFVEEVWVAYGSHFDNVLVMSLTFVTNVKTYGPFGNPYHQNEPATHFRFMADEDSSIVGFHGRSGTHLYSIGVYTCPSDKTTVRALSVPVILMGQSLPTPTKSGPWGGSAGTACDIKEKPWRLKSLTISYLGLVDAFSFSYIDQAGKKQSAGPWGQGYHHDKIETILFDPSEFVEEVSGAYGNHHENILVTSLTFVTNVRTYGPFGNPRHQNVPATPFRFRADKGSKIVGFHGRSGSSLNAIGVYTVRITEM